MKWAENYAFLKTTGGTVSGPLTVASLTVTGGATLDGATATTPATPDNSTKVATTAFVKAQGYQTGNQTITLSGDISGSGTTAITTTLPNVNASVGTFQGITVNAKGQVTAAANQNYVTGGPYLPLTGVTNGGNAAAGQVGEVLTALNTAGIVCGSGATTTIASLALTAGDWDVDGEVWAAAGGGTNSSVDAALNLGTAAIPATPSLTASRATASQSSSPGLVNTLMALSRFRASITTPTTVYLVCVPTGIGGIATNGYGKIIARRMR